MATFLGYSNFNGKNGSKFSADLLYDILEQNIAGNYHRIRLYGYIRSWDGYSGSGSYAPFYINGQNAGGFSSILANQYSQVAMLDVTVQHDDAGKGVLNWSLFVDTSWTLGDASASGSLELPTIPQASQPTSTSANIGDAITIYTNRRSPAFTHTITWSFGSLSGTVATNVGDSCLFQLPQSLYSQIPNSQSGTGVIYCETYNGGTKVGNTLACNFNAYANQSACLPNVSIEVKDINESAIALTGSNQKLIKFFSNAQVDFSSSAKNYASITANSIYCGNGQTMAGNSVIFSQVESGYFKGTATDSRGFSNSIEKSIEMIPYAKLTLNCEASRVTPTGSQVLVSLSGNYYNSSFGTQSNTLVLKYRHKESESSTWSEYEEITPTIEGNVFSFEEILDYSFNYQKYYDFEFVAVDKITQVISQQSISPGIPIMLLCEKFIELWGNKAFYLNENEELAILGDFKIGETTKSLNDIAGGQ